MSRSALKSVLVPINQAGWPFIALFAAVAVAVGFVSPFLGFLGLLLTCWCIYFFRDPPRVTPVRQGLVISAADGVVQSVERVAPPPELGLAPDPLTRVAVFMNVFDVHVNRAPIDGTISRIAYRPGRFFNASLDKASEHNERHGMVVVTTDNRTVVVVQIAGLIARRILCWRLEGQSLRAGERFGMIRFGSRVDIYLPDGVAPLVTVGQRSIAGETVIADMRAQESQREGEVR